MMKKFHQFCEENQLKYYLAAGTLLGAIRHNGFIPWDDDVDIYMPRNDFEKLKAFTSIDNNIDIVSNERSQQYYHPYTYINLTDNRFCMDELLAKKPTGKGVFLDIFPLDGTPNDKKEEQIFLKKMKRMNLLLTLKVSNVNCVGLKKIVVAIASFVVNLVINPDKQVRKMEEEARDYLYDESDRVSVTTFLAGIGDPYRFVFNKECFYEQKYHNFEDSQFYVMGNWDEVLRTEYGDYMTPPQESKRIETHMIKYYWKIS